MLCPGMVFGAGGRIFATPSPGCATNFFNEGVGFLTGGALALDTSAPPATPASFTKGIAQNATGSFYCIVATHLATDVFVEGIRVSALGQIVVESADSAGFASGNPITAAGNFAIN